MNMHACKEMYNVAIVNTVHDPAIIKIISYM